ncbi:DENN domain-containing protein 1A isoform X2 [Procambarus clarkii]|uniref:DENN domain-containing protein 1A isoform X2 n=1 Tax=Procambarus clarkii TaxID=6728 RepID=UPI001E674F8D|nr:DENN domain-containing protein 1A-like isoform X2 [Procambarus clarkii]
MGSRLRENPRRLLECWCEVVGPKGSDRPAWIIQKFPNSYNKEEILKCVPQFAFPCSFESLNVQHFSFVLTSLDSKWTYGFCRHAPGAETALVILSHLPWHETFYKLLNQLSEMMSTDQTSDMTSCLQNIYKFPVPPPGSDIIIPYGENKSFIAQCPNHLKLPTIPENRNLAEYYNAVDTHNMIIIFASMLYERRIIMVSKRLSRLSACVQAANSVIYPMQWQHIFIPVLPQHLLDYLLAPMPFLIGVNTLLLAKVQMDDVGEAVILDADNNTVKTPFNDVDTLPDEVVINLKRNLKSSNNMLGDSVARAFLRALVQLIGNYKEALQFREEDSQITFNREKFVAIRPPNFQPFVEKMLELQIFQQFIEERLERLNSGKQTSDEFELEVSVHCEKSSSKVKQQYKQFVTNVRKEGGAIVKTMKNKTNPAVKSAVKSVTKGGKQVKEKGRQTYKEFRGKIKDFQQPRVDDGGMTPTWVNGESPQKPRSAPSSPVPSVKRRPRTVGGNVTGFSAKATYKRASQINILEDTNMLSGRTRKYELIETGSGIISPSSTDSLSTPSPQSIDLMGEMEEIIRAKLGQDSEAEGDGGESSTGGSSQSLSVPSSVRNSPGSGSGSASTVTVHQPLQDNSASLMASKKHLSASLTSLPLIDLSLNIELPPPIMASFGYRFPVTFDDDTGGGEDEDVVGSPSSSHFRSPKLLHDDTDSADTVYGDDGSSVLNDSIWGQTQLSPHSPSPRPSVSNVSAVCTSHSTSPRGHNKSGTLRQFCDSHASECSASARRTTPATSYLTGTCNASSVLSSARMCFHHGHEILSSSKSSKGLRHVDCLEPPSSCIDYPKYGASKAFSASLSKYSTKGGTPGYFYSKLTKSIDDTAPVAEFEAIENSEDSLLCSPVNIPQATSSSHVRPGYAGNFLFFSASHPIDIMTMSLPAVLTSLSPPLRTTSPQGRSLSPLPQGRSLSPSPQYSYYAPTPPRSSSPLPSNMSAHPPKPWDSSRTPLNPLPPPPPSLGRRTRSPSPHLGLDQGLGEEDGLAQDLIFLESPQDEIFDPLLAKDIPQNGVRGGRPTQPPPPVPTVTRSSSSLPGVPVAGDKGVGVGSLSTSQLPGTTAPHPALARTTAINTTGLPNATPKRPSEYRLLTSYQPSGSEYRPLSTLQTSMGTPIGCQNPIYNQHQPPGVTSLPSTTRAGNAAAAFASSMLSHGLEEPSMTSMSGQYVQFEPPFAKANKTLGSGAQPQRPPRLSQRDLLGDFSKDFQKLTVNSSSKTATAGNNNNTLVNNNKIPTPNNDIRGASETKWATFD